jgi:hypothetical protein
MTIKTEKQEGIKLYNIFKIIPEQTKNNYSTLHYQLPLDGLSNILLLILYNCMLSFTLLKFGHT